MNTTDTTVEIFNKKFCVYLIIPIALVQSQLYWLCSVLCCALKECKAHEQEKKKIKIRKRAYSDPQFIKSKKLFNSSTLRRSNTSDDNCCTQDRPTLQDERAGTTCPPVWWQKTKLKLKSSSIRINTTKSVSLDKLKTSSVTQVITNDIESNTSRNSKKNFIYKIFHRR